MREQFKITIDASREKVWTSLFDDKNYREWTAAFAPGSWADTDWKKGSKAFFMDEHKDGMSSIIEDSVPNEFMSIKHIGGVVKGVEQLNRPEDEAWRGAHENYTLKENNGKTDLIIDLEMDGIDEKMADYFKETWPKALDKVKAIAERS